jgi:hypothetical protein
MSWEEVPAQIVACDLKRHKGSRGGATYEATATYTYTFNGQEYTGNRVGIHSGSDNGAFQHADYGVLRDAKNSGRKLPCRVNPANPDDAVLFWRPRPERVMLMAYVFGFAFAGSGFLALCAAYGKRRSRKTEDRRIRMREANRHIAFAVPTAAASLYVPYTLWLQIQALGVDGCPWWSYLPLLLVATLIVATAYCWIRFKKFGVSFLELAPYPAVAGQTLRATVRIPRRFDAEAYATLRYVHQYTTGSGKSRSTATKDIWKETKPAALYTAGEDETHARADFEIQRDHTTTAAYGDEGYWWELTLKSEVPGVNYKATFEVTVS